MIPPRSAGRRMAPSRPGRSRHARARSVFTDRSSTRSGVTDRSSARSGFPRLGWFRAGTPLLFPILVACGEAPAPEPPQAGPDGVEPLRAVSFEEATRTGAARIRVLYVPSSGFAQLDGSGRPTGVTVELMRRFARFVEEAHGLEVEIDFVREERWATFYQRVLGSEGGVFGIGNVTITEARREELAFSPPYLGNVATLMTHRDVPELESLEEVGRAFASLTGLRYPGTLHEERLEALRRDHFPEMTTVTVESNDELVGRTASGDGYFGYIDIYNYWRAVEQGLPLRRHAVADDDSEVFGVIMPLESDWAPVMEEFFQASGGLRGTDWYRELLREHLGDELAGLLEG
jgi:ABC-type amino acid transport substrate-binding protein